MAAPNYLTEAEYAERMKDFTGYIGHMNNQTKSDLRKEIVFSEERIKSELRDEIAASEARVMQKVDALSDRVDALSDRVDALSDRVDALDAKVDALSDRVDALSEDVRVLTTRTLETHKMLQLVLDQLSAMRADRRRD